MNFRDDVTKKTREILITSWLWGYNQQDHNKAIPGFLFQIESRRRDSELTFST